MEITVKFATSGLIRIIGPRSTNFGNFSTDARGILTWDCPAPGIYNFLHIKRPQFSVIGKHVVFPFSDDELELDGCEGWVLPWNLTGENPDTLPRIAAFGICTEDMLIGEANPIKNNFVLADWNFSGPDALDGETSNATASTPFPLGTYKTSAPTSLDMVITGIIDGTLSGGVPKAIEIYVLKDIPDLSIYGFGSANNGGGSDGEEWSFPADSTTAGTYIYVSYEPESENGETTGFTNFFDFPPDYDGIPSMYVNGDDATELFKNGQVIDTFGDVNVDGTGQPWEYMDGWAYRIDDTEDIIKTESGDVLYINNDIFTEEIMEEDNE